MNVPEDIQARLVRLGHATASISPPLGLGQKISRQSRSAESWAEELLRSKLRWLVPVALAPALAGLVLMHSSSWLDEDAALIASDDVGWEP